MNTAASQPISADLSDALEVVLRELVQTHQELLELVREHRRAISRSDAALIQDCILRQGMLGARGAHLERQRREIVQSITGQSRSTMTEVCGLLSGETSTRVAALADRLRATLAEIQRENHIVRAATHALMAHIDGLMQQVARALSRAGTYGRQGRVDGGPVACGLDMVH